MNKIELEYLEQSVSTSYTRNKPLTWGYYISTHGAHYAATSDGYVMNVVRGVERPYGENFIRFEHTQGEPHEFKGVEDRFFSTKIDPVRLEIQTTYQVIADIGTLSLGEGSYVEVIDDVCWLRDHISGASFQFGNATLVGITQDEANSPAWCFDPLLLVRAVHPVFHDWTLYLPATDKKSPFIVKSSGQFSSIVMPMQPPAKLLR